ncbi:hypothetical protein L1987_25418 [Smallanthus sonchifolius]|uniref:Uncharacterized protein n=1 Tax=Smallanthus sonchifolius TaxID=185202 RepID=A0ACB9IN67_9ASTR|nr:hypothetical protein L1987_25418 [Smallanthus sonchifolius]
MHDLDDHHFDLKLPFEQSSEIFNNSRIEQPPYTADDKFGLKPGDGSYGGGSLPEPDFRYGFKATTDHVQSHDGDGEDSGGAMNSRVRESLVHTWINDTEISVHQNRLNTPYSESLLGSKFCIHAKGFEVNTARIGDAIYYGCVPVVLADHYDLPFGEILNWIHQVAEECVDGAKAFSMASKAGRF